MNRDDITTLRAEIEATQSALFALVTAMPAATARTAVDNLAALTLARARISAELPTEQLPRLEAVTAAEVKLHAALKKVVDQAV